MDKEDTEKQKVKNFTIKFIQNHFINLQLNKIRILTLPGITWEFERMLRKKLATFKDFRIRTSVTGCENDYKVFCISATKMPGSTRGELKPFYSENLKHYVCINQKEMVHLVNMDIFDLITLHDPYKNKYDCIWFDTTNTVISIIKKLDGLKNCLSEHAIVVFTILKGREHFKFDTNRIDYLSDKLLEYGLNLVHTKEYFDTCAMLHLIYTKNASKITGV